MSLWKTYRQGIVGGVVAAVLVMSLPAVAASVGDPFELGVTNVLHNQSTTLRGLGNQPNLIVRNQGAGPALQLITDTAVPPMQVTSGKKVSSFNADRVDNRHASQFIRAAYATSPEIDESIFNGTSAADLLTTTIIAPKPGILAITAGVDASGATDDQYTCTIQLDGFIVPGANRVARVHWFGVNHTDNSQEDCTTQVFAYVDPGSHTVDFRVTGRNTAAFHSASLGVIWIGFDGEGKIPQP